jgi:hypothetical protein
LESGLDAVVMEPRRIVYYQPDAHAYSNSRADAYTDARSHTHPHTNAESRHGM